MTLCCCTFDLVRVMFISIEGNVGSGKSSLARSLQRQGYIVELEPLDAWAPFLREGTDTGFFQCVVLAWYCMIGRKHAAERSVVFVERSPASVQWVFAAGCSFTGPLSAAYDHILARAHELCSPGAFVHLQTVPSECFQRVSHRGQAGDTAVTRALLHAYDQRYWVLMSRLARSSIVIGM